MTDKRTNQQLRDLLAESGKVLTPKERERLAEMQAAAANAIMEEYDRTQPEREQHKDLSSIDRILLRVPSAANLIGDIGDTLTVLTQSMIPALLPFLLIFLIFAEAERVRYGVLLFEVHGYLAIIVAYILVLGNAFIELAIQHKHSASDYERSSGFQFSFRILWERVRYILGIGSEWEPQAKSPALRLERLQRWLTAAILFLAIGGSMTDAISRTSGNWRDGLRAIAVDSSLLEMLTWLSGLVAAVVIVLLAQAIVAYAYSRAGEFYHVLIERKESASSLINPEFEQWHTERANAIATAQDQAERELLIFLAQKRNIQLTEQATEPNPTQTLGAHQQAFSINGHKA